MASDDPARAAQLLELAYQLRDRMARNAGYAHDRRLEAFADYAEARVREAMSDRRLARHRAQRAYDLFRTIGYQWRAAQCALLLHTLGKGAGWMACAQDAIAPYPRSFVAQQIASCTEQRNPVQSLTTRQREILSELCAGKTIDDISLDLGISSNTVRVHITRIHCVFNVARRSQLLREAAKYGFAA